MITINISMSDLRKRFGKKAKEYANDNKKTEKLIKDASRKAEGLDKSGPIDTFYGQLQLLFGLIKDSLNGSYKDIPKASIVVVIMGILYFISPIDLIPDFIPFIGYSDDAFVLGLVIKQLTNDIEKYKDWKLNEFSSAGDSWNQY